MSMTVTVATMAPVTVAVTHDRRMWARWTGRIVGVPSLQTGQRV